jgi:AcrR family transcriptional regulator
MILRHRAVHAEHKRERHDAILDAAERALLRSPDQDVNVADVAAEAGLAKGTVYLYFPSKGALLLAVHERRVDGFFRDVIALVEDAAPVSIEPMLALTRRHLVDPPLFLPLASRCHGALAQDVEDHDMLAFRQRMAARLERAGAGLEHHFRVLAQGDGVGLLRRSYALILGLWQMSAGTDGENALCAMTGPAPSPVFAWRYPDELEAALRALWRGMVGATAAAGASR